MSDQIRSLAEAKLNIPTYKQFGIVMAVGSITRHKKTLAHVVTQGKKKKKIISVKTGVMQVMQHAVFFEIQNVIV